MEAHRWRKDNSSTLSLTLPLDEMVGQSHARAALHLGMLWSLDEPQGRCGRVRKISPPPGFDPRTFQLVANMDRAIPIHVSTDSFVK